MIRFKQFALVICCLALLQSCSSTKTSNNSGSSFEKLVYHSSRCNGNCPQIRMQVDSNRNILVEREIFLSKSGLDSSLSGNFKGVLDEGQYNRLLAVLDSSNYETLQFPDVTCCDGAINTIIVYNGGKRTYLKSMTAPKEATPLINFLRQMGKETVLERTDEKFAIEQ